MKLNKIDTKILVGNFFNVVFRVVTPQSKNRVFEAKYKLIVHPIKESPSTVYKKIKLEQMQQMQYIKTLIA